MGDQESLPATRLSVGPFDLDPETRTIGNHAERVSLSPISARLLVMLAQAEGSVVHRNDLIDQLWDGNNLVGDPGLNRLVSETRTALSSLPGGTGLIQTVPRRGYRIARLPAEAVAPRDSMPDIRRWLGVALLLVLAAALLNWLVEGLIGLAWVLRQGR